MSWAKLDDGFFRHPKARAAGKDGRALFLASLTWAAGHLTDGKVACHDLQLIAAEAEVNGKRTAARLVEVGLWDVVDGGWMVHDYLEYNPTAEQALALKAKRAEAGRIGGSKPKRSKSEANTEANASANGKQNGTPSPYPYPSSENQQQVSTRVPDRAALIAQATEVIIGRRNITDRSSAYIAATRKGITTDLGEWACARKLDGYTPERLAQEYEPTAGAGSTLREIRGVLHRHVAGTGFVPITPAASDDAWLEEEVPA
jgi:hypothetical protein